MKNLVLSVVLCFVFVAIGYADRCSDLCNQCKRSQSRDISICCQAESACYENGNQRCKTARDVCDSFKGVGGDGDDYGKHNHFPALDERQIRREVQNGVDQAIRNWQQNFQNPHQPNFGFGI